MGKTVKRKNTVETGRGLGELRARVVQAETGCEAAREELRQISERLAHQVNATEALQAELARTLGLLQNSRAENVSLRKDIEQLPAKIRWLEGQLAQANQDNSEKCEHGIPRRFCTAVHAAKES
jgi:chromosome segregation ATPase